MTEGTVDSTSVRDVKPIFDRISANGINVDFEGLVKEVSKLQTEETQALEELSELTEFGSLKRSQPKFFTKKDTFFNPRSKKHINAWLVEQGEEETHSVAEKNIETRLPADLFELIMKARRLRKFSGDLNTLRKHISGDGKIHVGWTEATTGRWYAGKPNIQTMAKICRQFMVPNSPDSGFYVIDWRQQELRILAHVSQDPALLAAFENGKDPHVAAYERVVGRSYATDDPELAKEQREIGKMLNYALIYGLDAQGLGSRLRIDNQQAQQLIEAYFQAYPRLAEWRQEQRQKVEETGYVETLGGRKIPVERDSKRRDADENFTRKAVNYYVQGSAADQLEQLLEAINDLRFHGEPHPNPGEAVIDSIRATIHDALLTEQKNTPEGKHVVALIQDEMEKELIGLRMPVDVKGPAGTWREAMDWVEDEVPSF